MKNIVIGTAGHIDHGKTTLIKNLTNINTDTLKEEKERGMTIDLGFSYLTLPNNNKVSIIDVPGHEKFIKNMVSGCKGIDFVLFLIACDDGIMPQTIEHKNILKLLNIKKGIIILSKTDLVSSQRIEEVKNSIPNIFNDHFFKNFPILELSSKNPKSYSNLYNTIVSEIKNITFSKEQLNKNNFRLDIDKFYSIKGLGTVVSGTSIGKVSLNDTLTLYPHKISVKVKSLESHGVSLKEIDHGNRCALNISNINIKNLNRGNFLSSCSELISSNILHVKFLKLSNDIPKNNTKIRVHLGTGEYFGKLKYLHDNFDNFVLFQLIMDKEIFSDVGDIGIIRTLESLEILGSIEIINPNGILRKKNDSFYLKELLHKNTFEEFILSKNSFITLEEIEEKNISSSPSKDIIFLDKDIFVSKLFLESFTDTLNNNLEIYHKNKNLSYGISLATLKNNFFKEKSLKNFNVFINYVVSKYNFKIYNGHISVEDFKPRLNKEQLKLKENLFRFLKNKEFSGGTLKNLQNISNNHVELNNVLFFLIQEKIFIKLNKDRYILAGFLKEAKKRLTLFILENNSISLAQFRDLLKSNRDTALIILEYLDCENITLKQENIRILK